MLALELNQSNSSQQDNSSYQAHNTNMFDGVADQFQQLIAPTTSPLSLHSSFPLNASLTPYTTNHFHASDFYHFPQQPNLLRHPPPLPHEHQQHKQDNSINRASMNVEIEAETQVPELINSCWAHDEVLALFRIRSSMQTCLPDLIYWEHVSRKLAKLGFKRSAEKCRDKFEEESRYLDHINNHNENYCFISDLEQELYHQGHEGEVGTEEKLTQQMEKPKEGQEMTLGHTSLEEHSISTRHDTSAPTTTKRCVVEKSKERKRKKRDGKFEMLKGLCEKIVSRMMSQQEEMHNKLIEDMCKRDEDKFAREEAWKKQELDHMNKELQLMVHEQALSSNRYATIIELLNNFTSTSPKVTSSSTETYSNNNQDQPPPSSTIINPYVALPVTCPSAAEDPGSGHNQEAKQISSSKKGKVGRRWPRDEVLALINLRCRLNNINNNEDREGIRAPMWERISQKMSDMGYKRSAKRCKEKWENINKYFRKTKDINKSRSIHSRTCPYFHILSTMYSQGKACSSSI